MKARTVVWFSAGAASAVAAKLTLADTPDATLVYTDPGSEHPDNQRFIRACEEWFGKEVQRLRSARYADTWQVWGERRFLNSPRGALCTTELKKMVRQEFQRADDIQVFGYTVEEQHRADRFREQNPEVDLRTPLIERGLTKDDCLALIDRAGIELPVMYRLGYRNNNCIGCVKGGMGYWNKIRVDFPDVFASRARLEREIGASCIKGVYLDELAPDAGRHEPPIADDCGIMCELQALKPSEQPNASATMPNDPRSAMSGQKVEEMKCRQCGYAHPIGSNCPPNSELAAPTGSAMWMCPVCKHVMTEEQSKAYRSCPTGIHFVQHVQVELNHPEARCDDCGVTHGTAAAT